MRNLKGVHKEVKVKAYETIVRPQLEYASAVWDPHKVGQVKELERVQRRAARMVSGKPWWRRPGDDPGLTDSLLDELKWDSLSERRLCNRMSRMYKAVNNHRGWKEMSDRLERNERIGRNNHKDKLIIKGCNSDVGKFSFVNRSVVEWNKLDPVVVEATTNKQFVRRLRENAVKSVQ